MLDLDSEIYAGDMIITWGEGSFESSGDSRCGISFSDGTHFDMKPFSFVVIDLPFDPNANKLKLVFGNIWVNVKRLLEGKDIEVTMNQAVAGIRGTTFWLEETGEESTVWVEEGAVLFTHKNTGKSELVSGGYMARATEDDLFMAPFDENFMPVDDLKKATPWALYFLIPTFLAALGFFGVVLYRSRMVPATSSLAMAPAIEILTIGREPGNSFIIDDPNVSRVHAQIEYNSGQYLLTDFDSTNGTKVDGNPVQGTVELKPASEVSFGKSSFYFDGKNLLPYK